ncbi:Asparagine synthetase glutamine-hydrolyzing [Hondaea fermentalgiana]|uniref:asparagine synthase (glutamine-hydrolyzing) n=1 Tax=Hondaea fermentalgiana TaxID=2315210 RepID=A0A2R5G8S7_9STRA|nr:Asparagine synthetase glutamine-hydrolyzing [Hondaea fermentalgiana]|eukprot:GBG24064.1 Asparagine synthetase glutamine-hydrolyzing [Hondaea fermentalgiana]
MCGITALFDAGELTPAAARKLVLEHSKLIRHRGPDWSGVYDYEDTESGIMAMIAHERLAIVDPESGAQPLFNEDKSVVCAVNGELYNHLKVREEFPDYKFATHSDCEIIIPLYEKYGTDMVSHIDGMFAFVIFDTKKKSYFAARDHMGIVPLYIGYRADGGVVFCSELKGLIGLCERFELFKPGHYYSSETCEMRPWYQPKWYNLEYKPTEELVLTELRARFEKAVVKRLMSDTPWGVLLSGGLDSSLVSSVAARHAKEQEASGWPRLHSFSIGLEGSPDLAAAKKVADFLGTKHHGFTFTVQEGLDAVNDVIYHLETYDITTIRAATPMVLMSRKIKAMGVKMVLSGEGADEALGGYLYFHKAPNKEEFHKETVNKLKNLHYFDCLRANKAMSAYGVEPRVPFLDRDFLDYVMNLDPDWKMCKVRPGDEKRGSIEKYIMRKAFDTPENPYLPEEVLWRQKEQFSDGVGYSWIDMLRAKAEEEVTDVQFKNRKNRFPVNTPPTKEGYRYRVLFERHFPGESARDTVPGGPSIACSTAAAIEWDAEFKRLATQVGGDNSGRAVAGIHNSAYDDVEAVVSGASSKKAHPEEPAAKKQKQ